MDERLGAFRAEVMANREFVSISGCETLNDMISRARELEIDLEHIGKKGSHQVHILEGPGRSPRLPISI